MHAYYQRELQHLRQAGAAFAQNNPELAPHLGQTSQDADVERLLEGVAFLTARIQQESDAWSPELSHALLDVVAPELQCPIASQVIVQLHADRRRLRATHVVPAGLRLRIPSQTGAACAFQTTAPCQIGPIDALKTTLNPTSSQAHTLRAQASVDGPQNIAQLGGCTSRIFIAGAYAEASTLLLAIVQHTTRLAVHIDGHRIALDPGRHVRASQPAQNHVEATMSARFLPPSVQQAQTLLHAPQACLFFDFVWPDIDALRGETCDVAIEMTLEGAPNLPETIDANSLRLHCVAAINLFEATAMPLTQTACVGPQLVRPEATHEHDSQVHHVTSVTGVCDKTFARQSYPPRRQVDLGPAAAHAPGYYQTYHKPSMTDGLVDTYISVHTPQDRPADLRTQTLSVTMCCTNRLLPQGIGAHVSCQLAKAGILRGATTVTAASPPRGHATQAPDAWLLLGHLSLLRPGSDVAAHLKAQLRLWCAHFSPHSAAGRAHARRIDGIKALSQSQGYMMHDGIATACTTFTLTLDAAHFASDGDAYLFAGLIDSMLADGRGINQCHRLKLIVATSGQHYLWPLQGL